MSTENQLRMPRPALVLVKDFIEGRFVLYWQDEREKVRSPLFTSVEGAEEWWVQFNFKLYKGDERRDSFVDRRRDVAQRDETLLRLRVGSRYPDGRRVTDLPVKVEKDISKVSLLKYYARNPDLCEEKPA